MYFELTDHFIVASELERTWAFFSDAANLPRITPPAMGFRIETPMPVEMRNDLVLDYTIRWMRLPLRWRTLIIDWSPMQQFVDLQIRGPYTVWHHQHRFLAHPSEGGGEQTECFDRVIYKLPGGPIGSLMHSLVVQRQLINTFRYRREAIARLLGPIYPQQDDVQVRRM
jgi:ligand-binding SRPBCC domain-containing protein